jgi:F-type H+-transporting ATPase subunit a
MEHELWLTRIFNDVLAGPANAALNLVGIASQERPWTNWLTVEIFVAVVVMIVALMVRASLNTEKPGALQHVFEFILEFLKKGAQDAGIEHSGKYMAYFGTLFVFIAAMNLIGLIPAFESPTMFTFVPAGLAVWTFIYFNYAGFRTNGLGYLKHFMGPVMALAPFMFVVEMISLFIRPLSLTVRLYGNMFAGEQVTLVFMSLTKLVIPVIFMGLHVFVALVQAYVFTTLTMIYIAGATAHDHGSDHGHDAHGEAHAH